MLRLRILSRDVRTCVPLSRPGGRQGGGAGARGVRFLALGCERLDLVAGGCIVARSLCNNVMFSMMWCSAAFAVVVLLFLPYAAHVVTVLPKCYDTVMLCCVFFILCCCTLWWTIIGVLQCPFLLNFCHVLKMSLYQSSKWA